MAPRGSAFAISASQSDPKTEGRPTIKLNRLTLPPDMPARRYFRKQLERILKREVRRARWGAGRGATISYRFEVTELDLEQVEGVLRVRCAAVGRLPRGKVARSRLVFSGQANRRNALIKQVLEIVARGVITRLAELERIRRGELKDARARTPSSPAE